MTIMLKNFAKKSTTRRFSSLFLIIALITFITACRSGPPVMEEAEQQTPMPLKLILGPGDEIEIKFAYAPEFNELQTIRPDGKIELQFVGEVTAQGKTPSELREELKKLFAPHLKHPQLAVMLRTFSEQRVYVSGQVNTPGMIPMSNNLTALEAIMEAGGFDLEKAKTSNIIVIRHKNGQRQGFALDLRKSLKGEHAETFMLQPRDIVYVPRTTITKVNQWAQQYINEVVPDIGFTFTRSLGRTSVGYDTDN